MLCWKNSVTINFLPTICRVFQFRLRGAFIFFFGRRADLEKLSPFWGTLSQFLFGGIPAEKNVLFMRIPQLFWLFCIEKKAVSLEKRKREWCGFWGWCCWWCWRRGWLCRSGLFGFGCGTADSVEFRLPDKPVSPSLFSPVASVFSLSASPHFPSISVSQCLSASSADKFRPKNCQNNTEKKKRKRRQYM